MKNFVSFLTLNVCLLSAVFGVDEVEYRADPDGLSVRKRSSLQPAQEPAQEEDGSTTEPDYSSDDEYIGRVSGKVLGQLRQKENKAKQRQRRPSERSNQDEAPQSYAASLKRIKNPSAPLLLPTEKSPGTSTSLPNPTITTDTSKPKDEIDIDAI